MAKRKTISESSDDNVARKSAVLSRSLGEETVLRPVSKKQYSDDWPCFLLNDAVVYSKDGKTLGNLLNAELDGPFTVYGVLEVGKGSRHLQIAPTNGSFVRVKDVVGFSMADDPVTLWASGRSGWFEIRPGPSYESIYSKMIQGIKLYYFLVDIYEENRKRKRTTGTGQQLSTDRIFNKYAKKSAAPCTKNEAAQQCIDHGKFLLSQMRKAGAHVNWNRTTIFQWLKETCHETYRCYEPDSLLNGSVAADEGQARKKSPVNNQITASRTATFSAPPNDKNLSVAETIVRTMQEVHETKVLRRQHMSIAKLSNVLFERFELANVELAEELIGYHAATLSDLLQNSWTNSSVYRQILGLQDSSDVQEDVAQKVADVTQLVSRKPLGNSTLLVGMDHGTSLQPHPAVAQNPKASKSVSSVDQSPRRSSRSGKGALLRLARTVPLQDDVSPVTSDDESRHTRSSKRQKRLPSPSVVDDDDAPMDDNPYNDYKDADYPFEDKLEDVKVDLELVAERLPSATPQGPRGLWTCQRDGCDYEVPGADKPKGRAKVQAHFLEHADEIEAREQLVIQERRPHLPIDNLLEKIRSMGQAARAADQQVIGGRTVPLPIHRRLAI